MAIDKQKRTKRNQKWIDTKRDRINMVFTKGLKEQIRDAASAAGLSQSQWVEQAIREKMDRETKEN